MARDFIRAALLAASIALLPACGLHPLYGGGESGSVAGVLRDVSVSPIQGQGGWLIRNKLVEL